MSNKSDNKIIPIITGIMGFFGGITLVNNWLVLNKKFPKSEYFAVPLSANAWGNVTDWAMVLVTAFTAYYLVKTFRAQKKLLTFTTKTTYRQSSLSLRSTKKKDYGEVNKQHKDWPIS